MRIKKEKVILKKCVPLLTMLIFYALCWAEPERNTGPKSNFITQSKSLTPLKPDPEIKKQFDTYVRSYQKTTPFLDAARSDNIKVDKQNLDQRVKLYQDIYPGFPIDKNRVMRQMMAEKYLEESGEYEISDEEIQEKYNSLENSSKDRKLPELEDMKDALKAEILFNKEAVIKKSERLLDLTFVKNQEKMKESGKPMKLEKTRIKGDADECIVKLKSEPVCFVTIGEFNASLAANYFPQGMNIDTARIIALREFIRNKYYAEIAESSGLDLDSEFILEKMRDRLEGIKRHVKMRSLGRPVRNMEKLKETYQKYYDKLFKARDDVVMQVIGSSDSLHIDSLFKELKNWERQKKNNKSSKVQNITEPVMPWISFKEEELPLELVAPTDTFYEGQFSTPIKTAYGFFISKIKEINYVEKVPFTKAKAKCQYLATRDKYAGMDSIMHAKSLAYYEKYKDEFITPDTLELKAWLVPFSIKKVRNKKKLIPATYTQQKLQRYDSLELSSLDLPLTTREQLQRLKIKPESTSIAGPAKGIFGQWYFKIRLFRNCRGYPLDVVYSILI